MLKIFHIMELAMNRLLLGVTLIAFLGLTAGAVWQHGYFGLFEYQFQSLAGLQVLVDLIIALGLFLVWLWQDARRAGRNPWLWLIVILATGSIGALVYLLLYKSTENSTAQ